MTNKPKGVYKSGRFAQEELDFIRDNIKLLSLRGVARRLKRSEKSVKKMALAQGIKIDDEFSDEEVAWKQIEKEVILTPEFRLLRGELTKRELKQFGHRYARHIAQFKENITTTEQTQIFQAIKFEIFMTRHGSEIKKLMREKINLEMLLKRFWQKYKTQEADDAAMQLLRDLEGQLAAKRASEAARQIDYIKCQERHSSLLKELKATRDQRLARADTQAENITDLIKQLRLSEFRQAEGERLELVKMAVDKEAKRLSSLHTYIDGQVDLPILNSDTVETIIVDSDNNDEKTINKPSN